MDLLLRSLRTSDQRDAIAAHHELAAEGFNFLLEWRPGQPWSAYLHRLEQLRQGLAVPPGRVPATFLVAEVDAELVGRVSIRHELNAALTDLGGHIGYCVRSRYRRRGYATEMLRQALVLVRAQGVDRILITCDDDNAASIALVENAGGILADVRPAPDGTQRRRYWLT
jgi:predicted acetyltransferase